MKTYDNKPHSPFDRWAGRVVVALLLIGGLIIWPLLSGRESNQEKKMPPYNKLNPLTPAQAQVILQKGTERPFSGEYTNNTHAGVYVCQQCDAPLYFSGDKFASDCGWPSFDDEIKGAVERHRDADGLRTEILCQRCGGHLGHVFIGEHLTAKNTRHCVNSISMRFIPQERLGKAVFGAGCFWGVEYLFKRRQGVISTRVGYAGGKTENPTYREVCQGDTGHAEAIEVIYDPQTISFKDLTQFFFEIHDPGQLNRQGPDIGEQYRSVIFYEGNEQKETAQTLIKILQKKGQTVATRIEPTARFWPAEDYHQNYYDKKSGTPYCHIYTPRFEVEK